MSDVRIYRRVSALSTGPGWLVLLALGWTIEAVDERYWSVLVSRAEEDMATTGRTARRRIGFLVHLTMIRFLGGADVDR